MGKPNQSIPQNWPAEIVYLSRPHHSQALTKAQVDSLRARPEANNSEAWPEVPKTLPFGPTAHVRITPISDPAHPACGQAGLFTTRALPAGSLIIPYIGELHPSGQDSTIKSDYDLWLDRDADVAVDAAKMGNEARFVNDYRGVPGATKANAEFRSVWDARLGEKGMAIFVLPERSKSRVNSSVASGIRKGEEILVSYGKGFWHERSASS